MSIRAPVAWLVILATLALAACGGSDAGRARTTATDRVAEAQRTFDQRRDELAGKFDDVLSRLHATVPEASGSAAQITVDGRAGDLAPPLDLRAEVRAAIRSRHTASASGGKAETA